MIKIKNLTVEYESKKAVDQVSYTFERSKISGLIGPNGAGKSSLLKSCVGLIDDIEGEIFYDTQELFSNRHWVKERCGYAPEDAELLPYLKGGEFLTLIGQLRKSENTKQEVDFLFELLGLTDKRGELILNYSHGMRQKLSIASALISEPDYIILDEALNGLDPIAIYNLKNYLTELVIKDKTIIISSHILPLILDWCDPVIIIHQGVIINTLTRQEIIELEKDQSKKFETIFVEMVKS